MNLIIDIGNTQVKTAVFNKGVLVHKSTFAAQETRTNILELLRQVQGISKVIISTVGAIDLSELKSDLSQLEVIQLKHTLIFPFSNKYTTPKTLGVDRLALVSAAVNQFPSRNVLVIDAGTCVTFDFVNDKNEYLGGSISPGLKLRYKSLNNFTANLPLLDIKLPDDIIGDSTEQSIHSGVVNGMINEMDGVIDTYKSKYSDLTVILTGGDSKFLSNQLKNSIFANSNFLLEGLNHILEYNTI